jgi:hypothetical protein
VTAAATLQPAYYGAPIDNARILADEIAALRRRDAGARPIEELTYVVNRVSLELFRAWRWYDARDLCRAYLDRLPGASQYAMHRRAQVFNLVRLDTAVGAVDGAFSGLDTAYGEPDARANVWRELCVVAVTTGDIARCVDFLRVHDADDNTRPRDLATEHLACLADSHGPRFGGGRRRWRRAHPITAASVWRAEIDATRAIAAGRRHDLQRTLEGLAAASRHAPFAMPFLMGLDHIVHTAERVDASATRLSAGVLYREAVQHNAPVLEVRAAATLLGCGDDDIDAATELTRAEGLAAPRELLQLSLAIAAWPATDAETRRRAVAYAESVALDPVPIALKRARGPTTGSRRDGLTRIQASEFAALAAAAGQLVAEC